MSDCHSQGHALQAFPGRLWQGQSQDTEAVRVLPEWGTWADILELSREAGWVRRRSPQEGLSGGPVGARGHGRHIKAQGDCPCRVVWLLRLDP